MQLAGRPAPPPFSLPVPGEMGGHRQNQTEEDNHQGSFVEKLVIVSSSPEKGVSID